MLIWVLDEVEAKKESEIQNPMEIVFLIAQVQRLLSCGVFFYNFFFIPKFNLTYGKLPKKDTKIKQNQEPEAEVLVTNSRGL